MAIPSKVVGGGNNSTAQNVFRITWSQGLSAAPQYQAWDNSSTYPAVDAAGSTTAKEAFTGTAGNSSKPMYALVATTSAAPSSNWMPASATGGAANPNRLKGTTNYVTDPTTPSASGTTRFNLSAEFPSDASVPSSSSQNILLQVQYQYTGSAPTLTYAYNDGGTEGSPSWTTFTPGTHGIRLVNTGTSSGTYKFTLPTSSVSTVQELWVTA
jgi:hypothetical protein